MKKLALALTAVAAFTGSAVAADLPPAPAYSKAPVVVATPSWTGFYIFGGAGGGVWDADTDVLSTATGARVMHDQPADGWRRLVGTVGAGYDWQFNSSWVFGIFADGQFGSLKGSINDNLGRPVTGNVKLQDTWAAGARLGYLVAPNVLSYVNAGYTGSEWSTTSARADTGAPFPPRHRRFSAAAVFVGGGVENNLNIFGITAPGWFMKTEYRAAYFDRATLPETTIATGLPFGNSITFKPLWRPSAPRWSIASTGPVRPCRY